MLDKTIIKQGEKLTLNGKEYLITSVHYSGMAVDGNAPVGKAKAVKLIDIGVKPKFNGCKVVRMKKESYMVVECSD